MDVTGRTVRHSVGRRLSYLQLIRSDISIAIIIALTAFILAFNHLSKTGVSEFYEIIFAPAVNFACTGSFDDLRYGAEPFASLRSFIGRDSDTFDCKTLPSNSAEYEEGRNLVQDSTLYLLGTAALIWRFFGVSWAALIPLGAGLVAMFAASLYGVSRLFVGRPLAVLVVAAAALSPVHISMMPALRDYSKGPFILASLCFISIALFRTSESKTPYYLAIAGLIAGIGLGFRSDLVLLVPFCLLAGSLVFVSRPRARRTVALGVVAFLLCFVTAGLPVLISAYGRGGILGHVALLGLATPFNQSLGVTPTFYDIGHLYLDSSVWSTVNAYYSMKNQISYEALPFIGPTYNKSSLNAYLTYVSIFPADIILRSFAAIIKTINLDFDGGSRSIPWLSGMILVPFAVAAPLAARGLSLALYFILVIAFFAGSTSIQFQLRHAFYLEFLYWLSAAMVIRFLAQAVCSKRALKLSLIHVAQAAAVWVGVIAVAVATLQLLRMYQEGKITAVVERYKDAPKSPIELVSSSYDSDRILLVPRGKIVDLGGKDVSYETNSSDQYYLTLDLDLPDCTGSIFALTVKYDSQSPVHDYSREFRLNIGGAPGLTTIFVPAVSVISQSKFAGFLVHSKQKGCVRRVSAITKTASLPLPLWLVVKPDWSNERSFQALSLLSDPIEFAVSTAPPSLLDLVNLQSLRIKSFDQSTWGFVERNNRITQDGVVFDGFAPLRRGYGAVTNPMHLKKDTIIATRGKGETKASIGLLNDKDQWAVITAIPAGGFLAAVRVPQDGMYRVVLSPNLDSFWPYRSSVRFEQVGVLNSK
jgi:hypothetical protein